MSYANITVSGNVTREPRITTANTKKGPRRVMRFSVAANHGQGEREVATFFECDYWLSSDKAESYLAHVIGKGAKVCVTGDFYLDSYQASDGTTRYVAKVEAHRVDVPKPAPTEQDVTQPPRQQKPQPELDDVIPF